MKHFLSNLDHDRIVAAIAKAEKSTSGQIRVHVTRRKPKDLEARARRRFEALGMTATKHHNGVLIYIAPNIRRFRVLGDSGVHKKCGEDLWKQTTAAMEAHFRKGEFTEGILRGIESVGTALAAHFPKESNDTTNELPDDVTED